MYRFTIIITDEKLRKCNGDVREAFMNDLRYNLFICNCEDSDKLMSFNVSKYCPERGEHDDDIDYELCYYADEFNRWNDRNVIVNSYYLPNGVDSDSDSSDSVHSKYAHDSDSEESEDSDFNCIDFNHVLSKSVSKEMALIRKDMKTNGVSPGNDSHEITFYLTKEAKELIKSRLGSLDDIYYIGITTSDIDDEEQGCYSNGVYDMPCYVSKYSGGVVNWFDVFVNDSGSENEIRRASVYDNIHDKNKYRNQDLDFFIDESASEEYVLVYVFVYKEPASDVYLLHRRRNNVQTLEYINDAASRQVNEIMFYHGENGGVRVAMRFDAVYYDDGFATAIDLWSDVGKATFKDVDLEFSLRWKSSTMFYEEE